MSYNPFEIEYELKQAKLVELNNMKLQFEKEANELGRQISKISTDIVNEDFWHSRTSLSSLNEALNSTKNSIQKLISKLNLIYPNINKQKEELKKLQSEIGSKFNPLNWFNKERKELLVVAAKAEKALKDDEKRINLLRKELEYYRSRERANSGSIERYQNFKKFIHNNVQKLNELKDQSENKNADLKSLEDEIAIFVTAYEQIAENKKRVDDAIQYLTREIEQCYQDIQKVRDNIHLATHLQESLDEAASPNERRQIHIQSENHFGNGKPQKVIDNAFKHIESLNRTLEKLHIRVITEARIAAFDIKKIILDGSNLMNTQGKFIGTKAILPLVSELSLKYSVIVVFDPGAPSVLDIDAEQLRDKFPKTVEVHIASSNADELILDLAEEESVVILSHDRYAEYPEKKAIKEFRVFKPEIVDSSIVVPELKLHIEF